jgi:hypothetical protein
MEGGENVKERMFESDVCRSEERRNDCRKKSDGGREEFFKEGSIPGCTKQVLRAFASNRIKPGKPKLREK